MIRCMKCGVIGTRYIKTGKRVKNYRDANILKGLSLMQYWSYADFRVFGSNEVDFETILCMNRKCC